MSSLKAVKINNHDAGTLKAKKITNVLWLPAIAPQIDSLVKKMKSPVISYESLFAYFQQAVQLGGSFNELIVIFDNDEPLAFAHFFVNGFPNNGMVTCDFAHTWKRYKSSAKTIMEEYIRFAQKNRCVYYKFQALDEKRFKFFKSLAKIYEIEITRQDYVSGIGRKI